MCIHSNAVPESMCSLCQRSRKGVGGSSPSGRRSEHRGLRNRATGLDWKFRNEGCELRIRCDWTAGWRATRKSWLFCAWTLIDSPENQVLRVLVRLSRETWPRWAPFVKFFDSGEVAGPRVLSDNRVPDDLQPLLVPTDGGWNGVQYSLADSTCEFAVALLDSQRRFNQDLMWHHEGDRWKFGLHQHGLSERPLKLRGESLCVGRLFQLELVVALLPPLRHPAPTYFERDTPMPSAGLPSLGKRR